MECCFGPFLEQLENKALLSIITWRHFHHSCGLQANVLSFSCVLGAGTHNVSKNKYTGLESWVRSSGCVNIRARPPRPISSAALRCFAGAQSPEFQRAEGVQCYLCVPGSLTNSTLTAS